MPLETNISILVVCAKQTYREQLSVEFAGNGFETTLCKEMAAAQSLLKHQEFDLIFCEDLLPESLRRSARTSSLSGSSVPIIVVSSQNDWASYLEVLRSGAFDRLVLPTTRGELTRIVYAALKEAVEALNRRIPPAHHHTRPHASFDPMGSH